MSSFLDRLRDGKVNFHGCKEEEGKPSYIKPYDPSTDNKKKSSESAAPPADDMLNVKYLIANKPTKKKLIDFLKMRIEQLLEESDSD